MQSIRQFRFSKSKLESLPTPTPGTRSTYHDTEVRGLQARVTDRGAISFSVFRRAKGGSPERVTIGRFPALSIEQARQEAKRHLAELGKGTSVRASRRRDAVARRTLFEVHCDYLASRGITLTVTTDDGEERHVPEYSPTAKLKPLTVRDYVKIIQRHLGDWRGRALADITREMVEAKHRALSKQSPAQANLAMRYLRALFAYAQEYRDPDGHPVIIDNPVRRLTAIKAWNRVERRTRYIAPDQLKAWWDSVQSLANSPQHQSREVLRDYLTLLLLTGLRRDEALRLRWEHVDPKSGTITVVDTKNRSNHTLPVGSFLQKLLRERRASTDSEWVFASPIGKSHITDPHRQIANVVTASGVAFSAHDLRRTFASIVSRLGDRLSYYTTKRLLNHRTSDVTQGYIQFDIEQLRAAMQAVEDFVLKHVTPKSGTVVQMKRKRPTRR